MVRTKLDAFRCLTAAQPRSSLPSATTFGVYQLIFFFLFFFFNSSLSVISVAFSFFFFLLSLFVSSGKTDRTSSRLASAEVGPDLLTSTGTASLSLSPSPLKHHLSCLSFVAAHRELLFASFLG